MVARSTVAARASATSRASAPPTSRAAARSSSPPSALEGGRIETGNPTGAPFTTNATGVATGLNADRVDGKEAADFAPAADVTALAASLLDAAGLGDRHASARTAAAPCPATVAGGNVYTVKFNKDVSKCSFTASPVGSAAAQAIGVQATTNTADSVTVDTGAAAARSTFR